MMLKAFNFLLLLIVATAPLLPARSYQSCEKNFSPRTKSQVKFDISNIQFSETRPVFVAFEGWGHAYLQVGLERLEGHILDKIEFVENARVINRGYYFEILGLSVDEKDDLVSDMKNRSGACSVTCVGTIVDILQESQALQGNISNSLFLSDFFKDLSDNHTPIATHGLSPKNFFKRLVRLEERWIAQVVRDSLSRHHTNGILSEEILLQYFDTTQFEQDYGITKAQADQLRGAIHRLVDENKFSKIYQASLNLSAKEFDESRDAVRELSKNEYERFDSSEDALLTRIRPDRNYTIKANTNQSLAKLDPTVVEQFIQEAIKNREESEKSGHTLNVNDYINRHMSKETFELLAFYNHIDLMVIQGTLPEAEDHLASLGYAEIMHLPRYRVSDFDVFFAFDPVKKKSSFVIRSLVGNSLLTEIINHLVMFKIFHDNKEFFLNLSSISVFRSSRSQALDIEEILKSRGINPDVVFFAYSSNLESVLSSHLDDESELIVTDSFFARVLKYEGKIVLSVSVEPELHGDQSQNLLEALHSIDGDKSRDIIFLGTAGAIDETLEVDTYVIPTEFTMMNQTPVSGVNKALEIEGLGSLDFIKNRKRLISIESILSETIPWYNSQLEMNSALVEQEGYFVSSAARNYGFGFYAVYRVSDTLYDSENDFVNRESQFDLGKLSQVQKMLIDHVIEKNN